jgi:hypothetical protein
MIVNYDRKTFKVQATELSLMMQMLLTKKSKNLFFPLGGASKQP